MRYIDLFCGVGGFRWAVQQASRNLSVESECVYSCDIDKDAIRNYLLNFNHRPSGDIRLENSVPDHDLLLAGFPCQPFSIIGSQQGFQDRRGDLFFDIERILEANRPQAFLLENVKNLTGHDGGATLLCMLDRLRRLGYKVQCKVLNALDFGVPQKRERVFIVGLRDTGNFQWPDPCHKRVKLEVILESDIDPRYYVSQTIKQKRVEKIGWPLPPPNYIWHENKAGSVSALPYSCALRAGASHNYLLVNGERRLTERELFRLQGFPEEAKWVGSYSAVKKLTGNSVAVPCVAAVLTKLLESMYS